jgi:hypothetical protein
MRAFSWILVGVLSGLAGCSSCSSTSGTGAAKEDMQLVPKETDVVFMANLTRMRNTALWRRMLDVRDSQPSVKKEYDEFVKTCALDPLKQIDSVFVAFPESVSQSKEFAAILRGTFNEAKLVECAKEQAKKDNQELAISEYEGHKLYTSTKQGQAFAAFLDAKTVVLGGKEWIKKTIDLAAGKKEAGPSAKDNEALMALVKRSKTSAGLWGAGLVPQSARDSLKNDPNFAPAASMKDVFGSIDLATGFLSDVNVDLGSEADALELSKKISDQISEARKNPQFMMAGLNSFLESVKVEAKGPTFHLNITFNQQQVDDLINRVQGLLSSFRGALGGSMGAPPPAMPPPGAPTPVPTPSPTP